MIPVSSSGSDSLGIDSVSPEDSWACAWNAVDNIVTATRCTESIARWWQDREWSILIAWKKRFIKRVSFSKDRWLVGDADAGCVSSTRRRPPLHTSHIGTLRRGIEQGAGGMVIRPTPAFVSPSGKDWDHAREVVEPAVDRVAAEILAAGVHPGLLGAALVLAGANLVNENDGPDRAVRLLEGLIETLEARPKRPDLRIVGEGSGLRGRSQ